MYQVHLLYKEIKIPLFYVLYITSFKTSLFAIEQSCHPCRLSRTADRIIIVSIHQPRYSIFKLFDTLTLLSVGNLVYHGPSRRTLEYFEEIGECSVSLVHCRVNHHCPSTINTKPSSHFYIAIEGEHGVPLPGD